MPRDAAAKAEWSFFESDRKKQRSIRRKKSPEKADL